MLLFQSLVVFKYYSFFMNTTHIALFIHLIHLNIKQLYYVGVITMMVLTQPVVYLYEITYLYNKLF